MFKLLKDKLMKTISSFSKSIDKHGEESVAEVKKDKIDIGNLGTKETGKKGFFENIKDKLTKKEKVEIDELASDSKDEEIQSTSEVSEKIEDTKEELSKVNEGIEAVKEIDKTEDVRLIEGVDQKVEQAKNEPIKEKIEAKGFFSKIKEKIVTKKINDGQFEELFWNLETALLENNIALEVIDKIKIDLKKKLVDKPLPRMNIEGIIKDTLKNSIDSLFVERFELLDKINEKKPFVICFVGINGSGKTTTIAKITHMLKKNKKSVVLAAADTFRAAAISQLQEHADNLGVRLIKHDYGADPAAVAFDAIKHAIAKDIDVVLIDTAGRIQSNVNLQDEMKKIVRVAKPDLKIFVGEAITGNDCVEQAKEFDKVIGIDGIILAKSDIDEKGGAAISISYVTKKPILYMGTGQEYDDLEIFDPKLINQSLGIA